MAGQRAARPQPMLGVLAVSLGNGTRKKGFSLKEEEQRLIWALRVHTSAQHPILTAPQTPVHWKPPAGRCPSLAAGEAAVRPLVAIPGAARAAWPGPDFIHPSVKRKRADEIDV